MLDVNSANILVELFCLEAVKKKKHKTIRQNVLLELQRQNLLIYI